MACWIRSSGSRKLSWEYLLWQWRSILRRASSVALLVDEPVDQFTGNADLARDGRKIVHAEPSRIFNLRVVARDLTPCIRGREPDHQRMGKRPRLTAEIFDVFDRNAHFFFHLSHDRLFERLAGLHKPSENT